MPFVPPPDGGRLHLSQATLVPPSASASVGRALLFARAGEHGAEVAVASLRGDGKGAECVGLDLIFDEYTEFRVDAGGGAAGALPCVHLAGYHLPDFGEDGDEEDEFDSDDDVAASSDDEEAPLAVPIDGAALSTSDEEDDETDASDSDALSESEDDDEEAAAAARAAQGVVIEELPPDGDKAAAAEKPALPAPGDDDDDEESSGSEEEDDESESGSESESESDDGAATGSDDDADDEPAVPAPEWGGGKRKPAGEAAGGPPAKKGGAAAPATPAQAADVKKPAQPAKKQEASAAAANKKKEAPAAAASKIRRYDNGFIVEELAPGRPAGKRVTPGARVDVRYVGKLAKTGKVFDATKGASTFTFRCGVGEVIKAWDRGVAGAVEGAKLRITAPPAMAYGASGVRGAIPGNATLVFDVEVVRVR